MLGAYAVTARLVPKTVFGEYQLATTLVGIAALAAYPKMPGALITAAARGAYGTFPAALAAVRGRAGYGTAALFAAAGYYAATGRYGIACTIAVSAAFFLPYAISGFYEAYCVGSGKIREYAAWSLAAAGISACALVAAALAFPQNAAPLCFAFFCANAATAGTWAYRVSADPAARNAPVNAEALSYGKKTSWTETLLWCANYADILLLNAFLGPREVAVYGIARMAPEGVKGLVKNLGVLSAARVATMDNAAIRGMFFLRLTQATIAAFGAAVAYVLLAPFFFRLAFPTYPEALIYSQLLAVSFLAFPAHLAESTLGALLKKKETVRLNGTAAVAMLFFSCALIPPFGILGAVAARVLARFSNAAVALSIVLRSV